MDTNYMRTHPPAREQPKHSDPSALCSTHGTHAVKYCPDLRQQFEHRRQLQHQRERLARHRGRTSP